MAAKARRPPGRRAEACCRQAGREARKAAPAPAAVTSAYSLIDVKGLGPKAVPLLAAMGVATLADLAGTDRRAAPRNRRRPRRAVGPDGRDRWVEQAQLLVAGDVAGFEATYGKL